MAAKSEDARSVVLSLSTEVIPADQVEVDGEPYDLLGFKHLSDEDEAIVMGALARYDKLSTDLVMTNDDKQAVAISKRLREKRIQLLTKLTTVPRDVITKLPLNSQIQLVRTVQKHAGLIEDDGGAGS